MDNNLAMSDFLITFYMGKKSVTKLLSEVIENKDNKLFLEEIGLPKDFELPFFQEKGENSLLYTIKNDDDQKYQIKFYNDEILDHIIQSGDYFTISNKENGKNFSIHLIDTSDLKVGYQKFRILRNQKIFIGRTPNNDISYSFSNLISRDKHFAIRVDGAGNAYVEDLKRSVGIYVNGELAHSKKLKPFDEIEVLGLSIIYLGDAIAVRDFHSESRLLPLQTYPSKDVVRNKKDNKHFVRSPRILKSLDKKEIDIDGPPAPPTIDQTPAILVLGPSLTMALVMLASFSISIANAISGGNIATVISSGIIAVGMLVGSLLWPMLIRNYQKRMAQAQEVYRQEKYTHYINEIENELSSISDRSIRLLNQTLKPSPESLCSFLDDESSKLRLWERSYQDSDFLSVRVGLGDTPFDVTINAPREGFQLQDDNLRVLPHQLQENYSLLHGVPVTLDIFTNRAVGIIGNKRNINTLLDEILLNITSLHSYDEVKLVLVTSPKEREHFYKYRNLPHVWSNDKNVRFFATNPEEVHYIFNLIDEVVKERESDNDILSKKVHIPHFVFVITDPSLIEKEALLRYMNNAHNTVGITTIFAYGDITQIPKSCETIIQSDSSRTGYYIKNQNENRFIEFELDNINNNQLQKFTNNLSNLLIKRDTSTLGIPERVSFLQMYEAGNVHDLKIIQNWESNNSSKSLAAPIGILAGGDTFDLDIHEAYHGCHGLVAGTTGSGKSEFLQEYILSLAVNYSPKEVAFVLVDFKGGDMARPFMEKPTAPSLPHLAATISNLSENILYRALVSFKAEIDYRQRLFNESAMKLGVDKLDINSYHKYFKAGKLDVPLPHLIIIIDEFAQLKSQQPEFLQQLISIAQVGRSLGIHLILATQKPSGQVDPQIWSNSRFRVCLRVADKQDSLDMINKPDSALIKNPGRMYVQVGYDEIYECVQSGYSGANYEPTDKFISEDEITIRLTDNTANPIYSAKLTLNDQKTDKTQLEATVAEIVKVGEQKGFRVKPLWLDLLPEKIFSSDLKKSQRGLLSATLGLVDYVKTQEQKPLTIDFEHTGHIGIYGASGTGKTTFLQTLVYSLVNEYKYTPEELNIYAMDFGGRNLGYLETLPHTGSVIYADEADKLEELIQTLNNLIEERKHLFAKNNVGTFSDYKEVAKNPLPAVVVLLDNYASFYEKYYELSDRLVELISSGRTFGLYFVITGSTRNAIHYKASEHISTYFTLKMIDPSNYFDILNVKPPITPEDVNGRGITVINKDVVEFQTALAFDTENEAERISKLSNIYNALDINWNGIRPVPITGEDVEATDEPYEDITPVRKVTVKERKLSPIDEDENNLVVGKSLSGTLKYGIDLQDHFKVGVNTDGHLSLSKVYKNLLSDIENYDDRELTFIDFSEKSFNDLIDDSKYRYINSIESLDEFIEELKPELNDRLEKNPLVVSKRHFIVISDFNAFFDQITDEQAMFMRKVMKYIDNPEYNITFITGFNVNNTKYNDSLFLNLVVKADYHIFGPNSYKKATEKIEDIPIVENLKPNNYYLSSKEGSISIV